MSSNLKALGGVSIPAPLTLGERNRWFKFLNRTWVALRKRTRRNSAPSRASDWSSFGL